MATHFLDYHAVDGSVMACGRSYDLQALPRGVVVSTGTSIVSCMRCIQTQRFRLAKIRALRSMRPLDQPSR